jgi:release factor glutamine methyltransferase
MTTGSGYQSLRIEAFLAEFLAALEERPSTYAPREDSFMMLEALADLQLQGLRVLDIGTGSGILAAYCARRGAEVTASDIDIDAIEAVRRLAERLAVQIELVVSDLFSRITGQFDVIIFNPPYLPSRTISDRTVDGGKQGVEVIDRFLSEATYRLRENGFAVVLVSSINDPENLRRRHPQLRLRILREQSLFFERLTVLEVKGSAA